MTIILDSILKMVKIINISIIILIFFYFSELKILKMFCFFFAVCLSEDSDSEEDNEIYEEVYDWTNYIEANLFYSNNTYDIPPRSKMAYVTSYSNDIAPTFDYIQMLTVLGYSLKLFNPTIDRVVIVREEFRRDVTLRKILEKSWTHVLYRPVLKWPDSFNPKQLYHAKWFKYHAWTLTQYEKILYMGADLMVFTDLSVLFRWQPPAAAYYLTDYSPKDDGPIFNSDLMLIQPDKLIFTQLIELTTRYLKQPARDESTLGRDDSAPLNLVYRQNISLFPIYVCHENGGYKHTVLGNARDTNFHVIYAASVHFVGKGKPWNRWSVYTEIWKALASIFYEKLDLPFRLKGVAQNANSIYKLFFDDYVKEGKKFVTVEDEEEEDPGDDFYPEIVKSGARRVISMICLVTFISLLVLKFIIGVHQPLKVFLKNWQTKIDQFILLEDDPSIPAMFTNIMGIESFEGEKKHKKRKKKKKKENNNPQPDNITV